MTHRWLRLETLVRVPSKALGDKVDEQFIVALQYRCQSLCSGTAALALGVNKRSRSAGSVKEELSARCLLHNVRVWHSKDFHYASKLLVFIFAREDRVSSVKLGEDTAKTPHVDGHGVVHAENDLGTAIESRLDVGVHFLRLVTRRTKVDDLDAAFGGVTEENILRL